MPSALPLVPASALLSESASDGVWAAMSARSWVTAWVQVSAGDSARKSAALSARELVRRTDGVWGGSTAAASAELSGSR